MVRFCEVCLYHCQTRSYGLLIDHDSIRCADCDNEIIVSSCLAAGCGMFGNPGESSVLVRGKVVLHSGRFDRSQT